MFVKFSISFLLNKLLLQRFRPILDDSQPFLGRIPTKFSQKSPFKAPFFLILYFNFLHYFKDFADLIQNTDRKRI